MGRSRVGGCRYARWTVSVVVAVLGVVAAPGGTSGAQGRYTVLADSPSGAQFAGPRTVAVDGSGRVYVTDTENHRIRRIDPSGEVITVAGTGQPGYGGDGGPATSALLRQPHGIALDDAGNLYVADSPNHRIRRIDPAGIITTVAGTGMAGFSGDGGPATSARLNRPRNLIVDPAGNLLIADTDNHRIRRVEGSVIIATIAGTGAPGSSGDGGPGSAASFDDPRDVALDPEGHLFVVDTEAHRVRRIDAATGTITTVAGTGMSGLSGDGGPAAAARLNEPRGVAVDPGGNLFIADSSNNRVRWVDRSGTIRALAADLDLRDPRGLNTDRSGVVVVADTGHDRVVAIAPGG